MGYHPETLAFSFPPYPKGGMSLKGHEQPWSFGRWLYSLSPVVGFDVWHIDPEKAGTGNRTDDSCGWFARNAGPYEKAVKDTLDDRDIIQHIRNTVEREIFWRSAYLDDYPEQERGWKRVAPADALALTLMVGQRLEHLRYWNATNSAPWWRKRFIRKRDMTGLLIDLALNPSDNLAPSTDGYPESFIRLTAAALHREIRPWWRHPRWHVHHWQVKINAVRNIKRMFQRCAGCGKSLGWNHCPVNSGGELYHSDQNRNCAYAPRGAAA